MRVIAGSARRIQLVSPKGQETRPTSDRAKESLFNMIADKLSGASVLDLFCGSGAIGIEALSRGAKEAVFVDSSKLAQTAVTQNLEKTKLGAGAQMLGMQVAKALQQLSQAGKRFDIIFLDPPYDMRGTNYLAQTLQTLSTVDLLVEGGLIIAETDTRTGANFAESIPPVPFVYTHTRSYGQTCFLFYLMPSLAAK